jgi:hypothetical protein
MIYLVGLVKHMKKMQINSFITDVFDDFKESNCYDGLSKADKSKIKKSVFNGKISKNMFLKKHYKKKIA